MTNTATKNAHDERIQHNLDMQEVLRNTLLKIEAEANEDYPNNQKIVVIGPTPSWRKKVYLESNNEPAPNEESLNIFINKKYLVTSQYGIFLRMQDELEKSGFSRIERVVGYKDSNNKTWLGDKKAEQRARESSRTLIQECNPHYVQHHFFCNKLVSFEGTGERDIKDSLLYRENFFISPEMKKHNEEAKVPWGTTVVFDIKMLKNPKKYGLEKFERKDGVLGVLKRFRANNNKKIKGYNYIEWQDQKEMPKTSNLTFSGTNGVKSYFAINGVKIKEGERQKEIRRFPSFIHPNFNKIITESNHISKIKSMNRPIGMRRQPP